MNITHAVNEIVDGDKLVAIFKRQKELMEKYHDIEAKSGLMQTEDCPVNLDDKRGQARIKDFSWRITEEIGEALDALSNNDEEHYREELIDGLHFLVELTILTGVELDQIVPVKICDDYLDTMYLNRDEKSGLNDLVMFFVMDLGMMCNCLKNKPWKQTNMLTDRNNFVKQLKDVWNDYISILGSELNPDEITNIYLKKSQVNKFRQRSNY